MSTSTDNVKQTQAKINKRIKEVSEKINQQIHDAGDKVNSRVDQVKESTEKANELARNIWLAGLGAYGKSYDEALSAYEKISKDVPSRFEELVKKGEALEAQAKGKLNEGKESLSGARAEFEERLAKARKNLDLDSLKFAGKEYIATLESKIEELTSKVEGIIKTDKKAAPAKKPAAKKPAAKKSTSRKPAGKKTAAKTTAVKKTPVRKAASRKPAATPATAKAATPRTRTRKSTVAKAS